MTPLDKKIIGQSPAAIQLKKMIALIAPSDAPTIIFGATGSGKELVAEALHEESRRKGRFVTINCAAIPKELIEALPSHPKNFSSMLAVSLDWYANNREVALEKYMEFLSE